MNQNKRKNKYWGKSQKNQKSRIRPDKRDLLKKRGAGDPQLPPTGKDQKQGWPLGPRIAFILLLVILGVFLWKQMNKENANNVKVSYTKFNELLTDNKISKVKISDSSREITNIVNIISKHGATRKEIL